MPWHFGAQTHLPSTQSGYAAGQIPHLGASLHWLHWTPTHPRSQSQKNITAFVVFVTSTFTSVAISGTTAVIRVFVHSTTFATWPPNDTEPDSPNPTPTSATVSPPMPDGGITATRAGFCVTVIDSPSSPSRTTSSTISPSFAGSFSATVIQPGSTGSTNSKIACGVGFFGLGKNPVAPLSVVDPNGTPLRIADAIPLPNTLISHCSWPPPVVSRKRLYSSGPTGEPSRRCQSCSMCRRPSL